MLICIIAISLLLIGILYALIGEHEIAQRIVDIDMWFFAGMGILVFIITIREFRRLRRELSK